MLSYFYLSIFHLLDKGSSLLSTYDRYSTLALTTPPVYARNWHPYPQILSVPFDPIKPEAEAESRYCPPSPEEGSDSNGD